MNQSHLPVVMSVVGDSYRDACRISAIIWSATSKRTLSSFMMWWRSRSRKPRPCRKTASNAFTLLSMQQASGRSQVATLLRKRLKLNELVLFETTLATQRPSVPFSRAVEVGAAHIAEEKEDTFELAVDIRRARLQRIHVNAAVSITVSRTGHNTAYANEHARAWSTSAEPCAGR